MDEPSTAKLENILLNGKVHDLKSLRKDYYNDIFDLSFVAYYADMLKEKGISKSDAAQNSGLELHYAYQIISGMKNPSRDKIICLCIGAHFSIEETNRALERAHKSRLYAKRLRDAAIMIALNTGMDTVIQVNELLSEHGIELLA